MKLSDDEQLTAVLLEGQVAEPLEHLGHLLGAPAGSHEQCVIPAVALITYHEPSSQRKETTFI